MKFTFGLIATALLAPLSALAAAIDLEARATTNIFGYAAAGGTTGGAGGATTRVSTLAALTSAVASDSAKIVILTASLSGAAVVKIGSNTSLYGASSSITLTGIGLRVLDKSNVIIRNLKINKVLADTGDAIGIQNASKIWLDHLELWSDQTHDKDYYDGLIDITHGVTYATVSWVYFHDHWKGTLVGHSDSNASEDTKITVTYAYNYFNTINSRTPSFRFGTGHIFNNYFLSVGDGINSRVGAQLLVENNVFASTKKPIYAEDGFVCARGNDLGGGANTAPAGTCFTPPYSYSLDAVSSVKATITGGAGAKLSF